MLKFVDEMNFGGKCYDISGVIFVECFFRVRGCTARSFLMSRRRRLFDCIINTCTYIFFDNQNVFVWIYVRIKTPEA